MLSDKSPKRVRRTRAQLEAAGDYRKADSGKSIRATDELLALLRDECVRLQGLLNIELTYAQIITYHIMASRKRDNHAN
jgi:hypothetical protein